MTNLVGGTQYQHAHAHQAWPMEMEGEKTFPFVASHGFGAHPMEFWLLPRVLWARISTASYTYYHPPLCYSCGAILSKPVELCGIYPRCHMKFYPKKEAGCVLTSEHNYWQLPNFKKDMTEESPNYKIEQVFLWQHYKFPFAFPHTKRTLDRKEGCVFDVLTYPPELTKRLLTLHK